MVPLLGFPIPFFCPNMARELSWAVLEPSPTPADDCLPTLLVCAVHARETGEVARRSSTTPNRITPPLPPLLGARVFEVPAPACQEHAEPSVPSSWFCKQRRKSGRRRRGPVHNGWQAVFVIPALTDLVSPCNAAKLRMRAWPCCASQQRTAQALRHHAPGSSQRWICRAAASRQWNRETIRNVEPDSPLAELGPDAEHPASTAGSWRCKPSFGSWIYLAA